MKRFLPYLLFILLLNNKIYAQYESGTSYYGINNYIEYIAGDMPIIIVAPHAGNLQPIDLPDINTRGNDNGTMDLARFMADSLHLKTGGSRPHIIINHLRPNKLNPVFSEADSTDAAGTDPVALQALRDFHDFIQVAHNKVSADWGKGHYFELHGNGTAEHWNMVGLGVSKSYLNMSDAVIETRVNYSTIKNLCTIGGADFLEVLKGPTSLGGMLESLGWKTTTSPYYPAPPGSVTFYYAGQNTWRYGSKHTGTIDATHLESYWKFMVKSANRSKYSNDLADSMLDFMNIHYGFPCRTLNVDAGEDQGISTGTTTTLDGSYTGGSGSVEILWTPQALIAANGILNPQTNALTTDTTFYLMITDLVTGVIKTDSLLISIQYVGIDEYINEDIKVYPNPVKDKLLINLGYVNVKVERIQLFNSTGLLMYSLEGNQLQSETIEITVFDYNQGVYFLNIFTEIGVIRRKIMILR